MPWEETDDYIRSGHENPDKYDKDSMRTIDIDASKGIKAVIGCPKGHFKEGKCDVGTQVQSHLFNKAKGWTMSKAKEWLKNRENEKKQNQEKSDKNTQAASKGYSYAKRLRALFFDRSINLARAK